MSDVFPVTSFAGLDLVADPTEAGPTVAVDLRNVRMDNPSTLRTRNGYVARSTDTTYLNHVPSAVAFSDPLKVIRLHKATDASYYVLTPNEVKVIDGATWATTVTCFGGGTLADIVDVNEAVVARPGASLGTLVLGGINAGDINAIASSPWSTGLAYWNRQDRVVSIGGAIGSANEFRIHFSNAGTVTTWGATDWIDLDPTDGGVLTAVCAWGDALFAFKADKFYVFEHVSIDTTGSAVFDFRTVASGVGALSQQLVAAGRDALYFVATDGVYRTAGGVPQLISGPIQRYFDQDPTELAPAVAWSAFRHLSVSPSALYLTDGVNVMVYWFATGQWSVYTYADVPRVLFHRTDVSASTNQFVFADSSARLYESSKAQTDDNGTATSWYWRSAWTDLGIADQEKRLSNTRLTGTGTVTVTRYRDMSATDLNAGTVTLGATTARGVHRKSWLGTLMSCKLSGSGQATVDGLSHEVRHVRPLGLRTPLA